MSTINPVDQLDAFGPERCELLSVEQARSWCRRLALGRYENFSVLSALVPRDLRDDFAAVYAFCRWADDLGDEVGDPVRSLELLAWWRRELEQCFAGEPRHPVFIALHPTITKHDLPMQPFDALIRAFEQDQTKRRYETWEEVIDYCTRSADPVGRLVLMLCGEPRTEEVFTLSDKICTALQLTNHWQDVKRDILERDRIYIPRELYDPPQPPEPPKPPEQTDLDDASRGTESEANDAPGPNTSKPPRLPRIENFEERLIDSAKQGWAVDREFLPATRLVIRECVERTWRLYEEGAELLQHISPHTRPLIWLFAAGGQHVLRSIEMWNYETALHRPTLPKPRRLLLVAQAWLRSRFAKGAA